MSGIGRSYIPINDLNNSPYCILIPNILWYNI